MKNTYDITIRHEHGQTNSYQITVAPVPPQKRNKFFLWIFGGLAVGYTIIGLVASWVSKETSQAATEFCGIISILTMLVYLFAQLDPRQNSKYSPSLILGSLLYILLFVMLDGANNKFLALQNACTSVSFIILMIEYFIREVEAK